MLILYISLAVLAAILFLYYIIVRIIFSTLTKRRTDPALNEVNLKNTHYEPYIEKIDLAIKTLDNLDFKEVKIKSFDNLDLYGLYYNNNSNKTVIMYHGYRAVPKSNFCISAKVFIDHGYNVLLPYLRCHSKSNGKYITFGYNESIDINSWVEFINNEYNPNDIVLYGTSMGAASVFVSNSMKNYDNLRVIVCDSIFKSIDEVFKSLFKKVHLPYCLLMPGLNLLAKIHGFSFSKNQPKCVVNKINKPIFFVHSKRDNVAKIEDSKYLYENINVDKDFYYSNLGGHTSVFIAETKEAEEKLFSFIDKYVK